MVVRIEDGECLILNKAEMKKAGRDISLGLKAQVRIDENGRTIRVDCIYRALYSSCECILTSDKCIYFAC